MMPIHDPDRAKALSEVRMNKKIPLGLSILVLSICIWVNPAQAAPTPNTCPKWEAAIAAHGLPVKWTSHVMWRESRCSERVMSKPNSNGTTDIGLMQINSSWRSVTRRICKTQDHIQALRHANCNLKVARYLYSQGGKHHWRVTSAK